MTNQYVIDIADLGSETLRVGGVFPPGALEIADDDLTQIGNIEWSGAVSRQGPRVRLAGALEGAVELPCVRCLEPSRVSIAREFDLFFEQRDSLVYEEHAEIELEEPDTRTAFLTGTLLALGDVVAEQVLLGLPMKPLCRNDCKGLCLECGRNLNLESCDCTVPAINPAFEALRVLKDPGDSRKS